MWGEKMKPDIKIFENDTVLNCLKKCLAEGYLPATKEQILSFQKEGKIDKSKWYDTGTLIFPRSGEIRNATMEELQNIEETYNKGGRVLFLGFICSLGLVGNNSLNNNARFVGVRLGKVKKHKHLFVCECGVKK